MYLQVQRDIDLCRKEKEKVKNKERNKQKQEGKGCNVFITINSLKLTNHVNKLQICAF